MKGWRDPILTRSLLAAAIVIVLVAGGIGVHFTALHDIRHHMITFPGWAPFTDLRINRMRPSLSHGMWLEFTLRDRYGEACVAYWRAWPWRRVEIYKY